MTILRKLDALSDEARPGWLEQCAALAASSDAHAWTFAQIEDSFRQGHDVFCQFDDSETLCGFACFQCVLDEAELLYLVVDAKQQGQGRGTALLQGAMQRLACVRYVLEVRASNLAAQRLYARLGYEVVGVRRDYYPGLAGGREDAWLMAVNTTLLTDSN